MSTFKQIVNHLSSIFYWAMVTHMLFNIFRLKLTGTDAEHLVCVSSIVQKLFVQLLIYL